MARFRAGNARRACPIRLGVLCGSLLIMMAACGRGQSSAQRTESKPGVSALATASTTPVANTMPSTAPSAVSSAGSAREPRTAEKVLMTWNAALDHHSVDELRALYGPKVVFYGQRWSAEQVLEAKRKAFAKEPKFRQSISGVHIGKQNDRVLVTFEKRSGAALKSDVTGSLVLEQINGSLKIVEESDLQTDSKLKPQADTCPEAAGVIVASQSSIQADMARVARENPEVNAGGLVYDQVEHPDRYSASQGYFHEDHYEPRWWIDASDRKLTIRDAYSGELLPLTAPQRALIERLCTGKAENPDE